MKGKSIMSELYYGEQLDKLKYIQNICVEQSKLYGYQQVLIDSANSLLESLHSIEHEEIKKYFCLGFSSGQYVYKSVILNREDNFADIESIQFATSILDILKVKYQIFYDYVGCLNCQNVDQDEISLCPKCLREKQSIFNGINIYFPEAQQDKLIPSGDRLIYEIRSKNKVLVSGGRFNDFSNKYVSGMPVNGFTLNLKELINYAKASNDLKLDIIILLEKLDYRIKAFNLARTLRSYGFKTDIIMSEKLPKLMHTRKYLFDQSARLAILFEAKQMKKDLIVVKDLNSSSFTTTSIDSIIPIIKGILNRSI